MFEAEARKIKWGKMHKNRGASRVLALKLGKFELHSRAKLKNECQNDDFLSKYKKGKTTERSEERNFDL